MKKIISIVVAALLASLSVLSAGAAVKHDSPTMFSHDSYPGIEFVNDWDDNLAVSGYTGTNPVLTVPETVYDKKVLRFDENALEGNGVVTTVIMNDNMTKIGKMAFYQCSKLSSFYYSKSLQFIDKNAFSYDAQINCAMLRNTATRELGANVYYSCSNLEYVTLPDTIETIGGMAFEKTAVRKIILPSSTLNIGARAFANCTNLEKVYVPESVINISSSAFYKSDNVTVYTPEGSAAQTYCADNNIKCEVLSEENFPSRLIGDTNGDGELNINDVTFMQREIAGYKTDFYPDNCDFNGDCRFNINDATEVQYKLVGLK